MTENESSFVEGDEVEVVGAAGQAYTTSRRATTQCARELERLHTDVISGAKSLHEQGLTDKPVIRQSPNRCIVQVGGVALTIAWLQNAMASVADGELLVILWQGQVAPANSDASDRSMRSPAVRSATALWEGVFVVEAEKDDSWHWRQTSNGSGEFTSANLAIACIDRVRSELAKGIKS